MPFQALSQNKRSGGALRQGGTSNALILDTAFGGATAVAGTVWKIVALTGLSVDSAKRARTLVLGALMHGQLEVFKDADSQQHHLGARLSKTWSG